MRRTDDSGPAGSRQPKHDRLTSPIPHRRAIPDVPGVLLSRPNRFLGIVRLEDGREVEAHIADRGRLEDILYPGAKVRLAPASGPARRTAHTLLLARSSGVWVCVDPAGANHLVGTLLERSLLPLPAFRDIRPEARRGGSRFDFRLELADGSSLFLEVKSAGAARGGVALFPDAPSARGARHCLELAALAREGEQAAIVLVAQRGDAEAIAPHPVDPAFRTALLEAASAGVRILGVSFSVDVEGFTYQGQIPILWEAA